MSRTPDPLVVATRGSRLALRQAKLVADMVTRAHPGLRVELLTVTTRGDADGRPFTAIGGKGLFTTEVERAVVEKEADVAVHSAKDLTTTLGAGCAIVCVPERASVNDVVVGGIAETGEERLANLAAGAVVGTSSMRRRALLTELRADVEVRELRGNLDTRLAKVARGELDAAILAAAGIERLDDVDAAPAPLDPSWWVPAPGQGALAVEALDEREDLRELFAPLEDVGARAELSAERAFAMRLEGGCSVPLGCLARASEARLVVTGFLGSPSGGDNLRDRVSGPVAEAEALGVELADAILAAGGADILADILDSDPPPQPVEP